MSYPFPSRLHPAATFVPLAIASLLFPFRAAADVVYKLDNGNPNAGGLGASRYTLANQFTGIAGGEILRGVSLDFHSVTLPGRGFDITIYSDPNNDGSILDGVAIYSQSFATPSSSVDGHFVTYNFATGVFVSPNQNFFVGIYTSDSASWATVINGNTGNGTRSWIFSGNNPVGSAPYTLGSDGMEFDLHIRVNATAIPEPSTAGAFVGGWIFFAANVGRRRRP